MNTIEELKIKYTPIIQEIIDNNIRFYKLPIKVEWEFFADDKVAIFGSSKKNLKLYINICSVAYSYDINEPLQVEYFILHEIRHIYQRISVIANKQNNNQNKRSNCWEFEFDNYINPNVDLVAYYEQDIEFDAFTFAYSIIKYKYDKVSYIDYPSYYHTSNDFEFVVDNWLKMFKEVKL